MLSNSFAKLVETESQRSLQCQSKSFGKKTPMTFHRYFFVALLAIATFMPSARYAEAQTTIVGAGVKNGNFNDDTSTNATRFFTVTPEWMNIGSPDQAQIATRFQSPAIGAVDGRYAQINDFDTRKWGLDTGYTIADGDIYNVNYDWLDAFNWNDSLDQVQVTLFTTADDTLTGTRSDLGFSRTKSVGVSGAWEFYEENSFYTATPTDAGKNLFLELTGFNGNPGSSQSGFGRVDNLTLTQGFIPGPTPGTAAPSSPLTGVNLFSDTFDRPNTADSADAVTTGMSSAVFTPTADTTYSEFRGSFGTADGNITDNSLHLSVGSGESFAGIDRNFIDQEIIDAGGFAIEAIVDPSVGVNGRQDNRFAAIAVGLTQSHATETSDKAIDRSNGDRQILEQAAFAFTVEDDGQYNAFDSYTKDKILVQPSGDIELTNVGSSEYASVVVHDKASVIDDGNGLGQNDFLAQIGAAIEQDEYKVRLEFAFSDFSEGSDVVVTAFIQDVQIDLDPSDGIEATPGDRGTYTFQWDGNDQNFIAFGGRSAPTSFDNLMIEALASAALEGDFNADGTVDAADYTVWRDNLGLSESALNGAGDGSGTVDAGDYAVWTGNYGATSSSASSSSVPEPTALLIALGLASVVPVNGRRDG